MFNDVEALWGELNVDSGTLLISVIYLPPSRGSSYFNDILDMIEKASNKELDMILLGDLNYDYVVNESLHTNPVYYIETLYDMSQFIAEKTRVTQCTASTQDIILTTNPSLHKRSINGPVWWKRPWVTIIGHLRNYLCRRKLHAIYITP